MAIKRKDIARGGVEIKRKATDNWHLPAGNTARGLGCKTSNMQAKPAPHSHQSKQNARRFDSYGVGWLAYKMAINLKSLRDFP